MKHHKIPEEIEKILVKAHEGKNPTAQEKEKVKTYVGTLDASVHHPVTGKEIPNPNPIEVDVSLRRPEKLEDRIRRIMSVSSRIAQLEGYETAEEADDFDVDDVFDTALPKSPFELVDHYATMTPEQPVSHAGDPNGTADPSPEVSGQPEASGGGSETSVEGEPV